MLTTRKLYSDTMDREEAQAWADEWQRPVVVLSATGPKVKTRFRVKPRYRYFDDIRKRNAAAGFFWFEPDTMRFFSSRVQSSYYRAAPGLVWPGSLPSIQTASRPDSRFWQGLPTIRTWRLDLPRGPDFGCTLHKPRVTGGGKKTGGSTSSALSAPRTASAPTACGGGTRNRSATDAARASGVSMLRDKRKEVFAVNFSRCTVESAVAYTSAVKAALAPVPLGCAYQVGTEALRTRTRALLWGGLDTEELNALARICGHPFAPDLPGWMDQNEKGKSYEYP